MKLILFHLQMDPKIHIKTEMNRPKIEYMISEIDERMTRWIQDFLSRKMITLLKALINCGQHFVMRTKRILWFVCWCVSADIANAMNRFRLFNAISMQFQCFSMHIHYAAVTLQLVKSFTFLNFSSFNI